MPVSTTGLALPLPPVELRFMGESDEKLIDVGDELAGLLVSHGLTDEASILDVGCGYGRLALGILHSTHHRGSYLGFDILARHVEWCRTTLSPSFPTMRFVRLDVRNERYNPKGTIEATEATFPTGAGSIDVIAMFSVYTHLYRPDIERYLAETRRVLRPGAVAVTTWFLFDEARLPQVTSEQSMHRMIHVLDSVTRYSDEGNPLRAIAYDQGAVEGMARAAGLEITAVERGTWAGEPGRSYQDVVVFRRPSVDTPAVPGRRLAIAGGLILLGLGLLMGLVGIVAANANVEGLDFGRAIAPFVLALTLPPLVAGVGILRDHRWAAVLGIVVGALYGLALLGLGRGQSSPTAFGIASMLAAVLLIDSFRRSATR